MGSRSRGMIYPSFARNLSLPLKTEGAGKTGCAPHPRSRVQLCKRTRTRAYRFGGNTPAFPAQWLYGLLRALPGDRLVVTVIPGKRWLPANLTPAPGRQDHTTSPYASVTFVLRDISVHRVPPHVRDDRDTPLWRGGIRDSVPVICPTAQAKFFCRAKLTANPNH